MVQMKSKSMFSLILLCVVVVLLAYSYIYVSPQSISSTRQAMPRPVGEPHTYHHSGFILVLMYSGQQGAGVKAVNSLQRWIKDIGLPMMIVEPFLLNSKIGVDFQSHEQEQGVKFSNVFDIDQFNVESLIEGLPEMVAWSEYITNAPTKAVFIEMIHNLPKENLRPTTIEQSIGNGSNQCTVRTITAPDNTSVPLCQVREAKVYWRKNNPHPFSDEVMYNAILKDMDPANITLILSLWRGPWQVRNIPNNSISSADIYHKFQDSPNLCHYMEIYQNKFLTGPEQRESRYVAVMIRAEHSMILFKSEKDSNTYNILANIEKCLHQVQEKTNEAMRTVGTSTLLVTSDVGYYGSGSWTNSTSSHHYGPVADIQYRVKRVVERLYERSEGWSFEQWEQSFIDTLGGATDRGYVAALQRVLATSSKVACLVMMGGGHFQQLALENYLQHTRHQEHTRCIHLLCMETKHTELFRYMITRAEK